jgi:hypothetical protein
MMYSEELRPLHGYCAVYALSPDGLMEIILLKKVTIGQNCIKKMSYN